MPLRKWLLHKRFKQILRIIRHFHKTITLASIRSVCACACAYVWRVNISYVILSCDQLTYFGFINWVRPLRVSMRLNFEQTSSTDHLKDKPTMFRHMLAIIQRMQVVTLSTQIDKSTHILHLIARHNVVTVNLYAERVSTSNSQQRQIGCDSSVSIWTHFEHHLAHIPGLSRNSIS